MKKYSTYIAVCAAMALMSHSAVAQSSSGSSQGGSSSSSQSSSGSSSSNPQKPSDTGTGAQLGSQKSGIALQPGQGQVLFRASQLIGKQAATPQGQTLGQLSDIVFHPKIGSFGVISMGNDRLVPVPFNLVTAVTEQTLVLNTTQQALNGAPSITGQQWANFNNPAFTQRISSYYGVSQSGSSMGGSSSSGGSMSGQSSSSQGGSSGSSGSSSGSSGSSGGSSGSSSGSSQEGQ